MHMQGMRIHELTVENVAGISGHALSGQNGRIAMNIAYNMDCMEYMRTMPDKAFDLAVVDPPYFSGPERRGYYGSRVSKIGVHRDYPISRSGKSQA